MATSSRRSKERSGGGAERIAAAAGKITPVSMKSVSTGKENPRPTSSVRAARQKPEVRPMARIDKSATAAVEESRVRKSASSVPRGRSSSPFDFARVVPDARKNSRVSVGPPARKVNNCSSSEKTRKGCNLEKRALTKTHPSKLHEKLTLLEGKVKRIASDIKKTKDMLDMNNRAASEMMLSDIHEKISGIEKAMDHVVEHDGDAKMASVKSDGNDGEDEEMDAVDAKSLIEGLNGEELEARLFPHHKSTKDGNLSNAACRESNSILNVEGKVNSFDVDTMADADAHASEVLEVGNAMNSVAESSLNAWSSKGDIDALLMADENLDDFDDQGKVAICEEDIEKNYTNQLNNIGGKTSTGGWFVSEGESLLLAHSDGSCSFYDIVNCEEKAEYKPPAGISPNTWRDCWIIRAPGADGCSGKYVVAASAGNSVDSGFCSWEFYTKEIRSFHLEDETTHLRTALAPLSGNPMYRRNPLSSYMAAENRQWWYKPCGPLIVSTASCQRMVQIYDIRDGDNLVKWELQKPVMDMDYASPLHWRNKGKVVIAESDAISLWDVSSPNSCALQSIYSSGQKISALHVNNNDAEPGGGVRRRISSSEAEGNDGVFCTPESINVLDFRQPSGIGLKIPQVGVSVQSAFSRGDSIYIGCSSLSTVGKNQSSHIQLFSLRKQRLLSTYKLPESNAYYNFTALTQVWGDSSLVMGICGLGLFVFNSYTDGALPSFSADSGATLNAKEMIGPDNMYSPSFDYLASRVLLTSRDRPACWRYLF